MYEQGGRPPVATRNLHLKVTRGRAAQRGGKDADARGSGTRAVSALSFASSRQRREIAVINVARDSIGQGEAAEQVLAWPGWWTGERRRFGPVAIASPRIGTERPTMHSSQEVHENLSLGCSWQVSVRPERSPRRATKDVMEGLIYHV